MSRCKLRGNDTVAVARKMMKLRLTSRLRTACSARKGNTKRMTGGIESPMMTLNAHILGRVSTEPVRATYPPNANANWKKETADAPIGPKQ